MKHRPLSGGISTEVSLNLATRLSGSRVSVAVLAKKMVLIKLVPPRSLMDINFNHVMIPFQLRRLHHCQEDSSW